MATRQVGRCLTLDARRETDTAPRRPIQGPVAFFPAASPNVPSAPTFELRGICLLLCKFDFFLTLLSQIK